MRVQSPPPYIQVTSKMPPLLGLTYLLIFINRLKGSETTSTTQKKPEVHFECDFESGMCGWQTGDTDEAFSWTLTNVTQEKSKYFKFVTNIKQIKTIDS